MEHLSPTEAHQFLIQHPEAIFIDCRSDSEYFLVGHSVVHRPDGTTTRPELICWSDELKVEVNPNFVDEVKALTQSKDRPIVIICRSGRRSVFSGEALEKAGFTRVINVLEGFEGQLNDADQRGKTGGWRHAGLAWEQL
jgi:rhodanese-related sulfurtransferase